MLTERIMGWRVLETEICKIARLGTGCISDFPERSLRDGDAIEALSARGGVEDLDVSARDRRIHFSQSQPGVCRRKTIPILPHVARVGAGLECERECIPA